MSTVIIGRIMTLMAGAESEVEILGSCRGVVPFCSALRKSRPSAMLSTSMKTKFLPSVFTDHGIKPLPRRL